MAVAASLGTAAWSTQSQAQSATTTTGMPTAPAASAPTPAAKSTAAAVKPQSSSQVETRITQLHRELKITSAQEADWKQLAQDMRDNAHDMSGLVQERNETKAMSAVDNLKNYEKIADAHADGLKKIVPDFEKLYDSMSPSQQKTADTVFSQRVNARVRTTATPSSPATKS
jgi:uncharacterized membrane-anchored protein YhcB (DUF1043 family)